MSGTQELPSTPVVAPTHQPKSWLSHLSRITTSGRFIPEIDGLRFIAIASVFLCHDVGQIMAKNGVGVDSHRKVNLVLLGSVDRWIAASFLAGSFGVMLFFAISGFILAMPFAEHHILQAKKPRLGAYLWRRVTRLEPPYIVNLIIMWVGLGLYYHWGLGDSLRHWLASVFYLHNQVFRAASTINGVAWTLEIEIQFYLLAPLLACVFMIRNTQLRRVLIILSIILLGVFNATLAPDSFRYQGSLACTLQYFLCGFLLADMYILNKAFLLGKQHLRWDFAAFLAASTCLAIILFGGGEWGRLSFCLPFCIFTFYLASFKGFFLNRFLRTPFIFVIGGMCYTIYLYHDIVLDLTARVGRMAYMHTLPLWANLTIQVPFQAVAVLAVAIVMFRLVERPCMNKNWPRDLAQWVTNRVRNNDDTAP